MTMVYGRVSRDGTLKLPQSPGVKTAQPLGDGKVEVEFREGTFTQAPAVSATVLTKNRGCPGEPTSRFISITQVSNTKVCFGIARIGGGGDKNRDFGFIAVGD